MKNLKTKITLSCATLLLISGGAYAYTAHQNHQENTSKSVATQQNKNSVDTFSKFVKDNHTLVINENDKPVAQSLSSEQVSSDTSDIPTFDDVLNADNTTGTTQTVDGAEITTVTNNDNNTVEAFSVTNTEDGSSVSIVNDGSNVIVTQTTIDAVTGKEKTNEQVFPIENTTGDAQAMAWTAWGYTNIAIGSRVFAYGVDTAIIGLGTAAVAASLPGTIAAVVGCSVTAAKGSVSFTAGVGFGYLATIKSPGQWLAGKLDTNHNGWIGIYYRHDPSTGKAQWKTI